MIVGCVKEIKSNEFRVGLTPESVKAYVSHGHTVYMESNAGLGAGFDNDAYIKAGARILTKAEDVWKASKMIVKVKEPLKSEYQYFRKDLIIYTYLHLAADEEQTKALLESCVTAIAYETIKDETGLPCLRPMSEVAGKLSVLEGARMLYKHNGGEGLLITGVTNVKPAKVTIIGAGIVGKNALSVAYGLNADVTMLDINLNTLTALTYEYPKIKTLLSTEENIKKALMDADLVVSGVLLPGAKAPKLIKRSYYPLMKKGAVIVDVAIDQGGSTEVSKPTTHDHPVFEVDGIVHYCVANMPGAVPKTSTIALNHATTPYGLLIADLGVEKAIHTNNAIKEGLNTYRGECTYLGVAEAFNIPFKKI